MSNDSKYNRALHCRVRGLIASGGGEVRKAKSGASVAPSHPVRSARQRH